MSLHRRVTYIIPVKAEPGRRAHVRARLEALSHVGTEVRVIDLPTGPSDLEYFRADHEAVSLMLRQADELENNADAVVVACFYDPGIRELRESLTVPVVGIAAASMHLAAFLGSSFSVLVGKKKWIPKMSENAYIYGFRRQVASWRSVDVSVAELHSDPSDAYDRLLAQGQRAVQDDMAEVLILGCAAMEDTAERLRSELGVPVVDPVVAGFKTAEMLADLKVKTGITTSKAYDYAVPGRPRNSSG